MSKPFRLFLKKIAIFILCGTSFLSAQLRFIPLNVDCAVFNSDGDAEYVEIYMSFPQKTLQYVKIDDHWVANFEADVVVRNDAEEIVFEKKQPYISRLDSLGKVHNYSDLRHVFACELPKGKYSAKIILTDTNAGIKGEYLMPVEVKPLSNTNLSLSDIQLAAKISPAQSESMFNKNGLQIIPNPSAVYHIAMPMLYYYVEAQHLTFDAKNPGTYTLESYVTDMDGNVERTFPKKKKKKPGSSAVLVGGNNVVTLSSAPHILHIKLTDDKTGKTIQQSKRFTLFKPNEDQLEKVRSVTANLMQSYYKKFSEADIDEEFDKAKYIAHKEEINIYKGLKGIEAKAEFLVEFWRDRDTDPTTSQNEFKIDYFQKVAYATENFRTRFKEGWKTDRGRVLLTYGRPNEIDRSPVQSSSRPYEIWQYNDLDGGSIFVFADMRGFGEYELLHSTYRKELNQPDWERQVKIIRDPGDPFNFNR